MTSRDFNPDNVQLREDIVVTRKGGATVIANLPRNLEDFKTHDNQSGIVGQLKSWWRELTSQDANQRALYPSAQAA